MDRRVGGRWLVGAGVGLVAAAVILALQLRGGSGSVSTGDPAPVPATSPSQDSTVGERPRLPDQKDPEGTPVLSETTVDGVRIRDHRTGAGSLPGKPRTPERATRAQRLPSGLVHRLNGKLQGSLVECTGSISGDARGPRSRVGGTIQVEVTAGVLQITEVNVQLLNVEGESARTAKQCLEQKWIGQSIAATDAEDAARHPITVSFALPAG